MDRRRPSVVWSEKDSSEKEMSGSPFDWTTLPNGWMEERKNSKKGRRTRMADGPVRPFSVVIMAEVDGDDERCRRRLR